MLASMLCHATMCTTPTEFHNLLTLTLPLTLTLTMALPRFVTPTEFHNLLTAVQQRSWSRMDRTTVLIVVKVGPALLPSYHPSRRGQGGWRHSE